MGPEAPPTAGVSCENRVSQYLGYATCLPRLFNVSIRHLNLIRSRPEPTNSSGKCRHSTGYLASHDILDCDALLDTLVCFVLLWGPSAAGRLRVIGAGSFHSLRYNVQ